MSQVSVRWSFGAALLGTVMLFSLPLLLRSSPPLGLDQPRWLAWTSPRYYAYRETALLAASRASERAVRLVEAEPELRTRLSNAYRQAFAEELALHRQIWWPPSIEAVRFVVQCIVSLAVLFSALHVIHKGQPSDPRQRWASGAVGMIAGYWLKL